MSPHTLAVDSNGEMLEEDRYEELIVAVGTSYGPLGDKTEKRRIRGPCAIVAQARTFEAARSDTDRGHARVLIRRGAEYFIAGCHFSSWEGEVARMYLHGPLSLGSLQAGVEGKPDIALLNAAGLAPVVDL